MDNIQQWWHTMPWRMMQTNLREIDMEDMDAERYAADLADFGVTVAMINTGGIMASYPSGLEDQPVSAYLHGDSLGQVVDACHAKGIRVIARMDFSKLRRSVYERHPDWAFRTADGEIVDQNGFIQACMNSKSQKSRVDAILKEALTLYPFDGVYCNMSSFYVTDYWGRAHGVCFCESCRAGFKAQTGLDAPAGQPMTSPVMRRYLAWQAGKAKEMRTAMVKTIRSIRSNIAIDKVDYLRTESGSEIGEPIWGYSASCNARQTVGPENSLLCDNVSVDFMGFRYRETSVSPALMELRQWQNLANSGNPGLYIMGRLDNHRDRSALDRTRAVFQFHKAHESAYAGLRNEAKVLLLEMSLPSRRDEESCGWAEALTACHIPFAEQKITALSADSLCGKTLVILVGVKAIAPACSALLNSFVERGGTVLAAADNGFERAPLDCMGVTVTGKRTDCMASVLEVREEDKSMFPHCALTPLVPFGSALQLLSCAADTTAYLRLIPDHPFGPPECCYCAAEPEAFPGVTVHPYGAGRGVCLPWEAGGLYCREGHQNTLNFMQDILFTLCGVKSYAPALSAMVELTVHRNAAGKLLVQLVNTSGWFGNRFTEPLPVTDLELCLPGIEASEAQALNGGRVRAKQTQDGTLLKLDILHFYEAIEITPAKERIL